ncbi:hypothetical protein DPX16_1216 [Anabarilius grahami]|uniref:Ig-like domain-containing protein n=1 Tax=Anabarilius grahami TaxID=495550 RepID=A0A3N0XWN3_ANAGA|nr:hypothetical protein DPX16_1216 [Anabarilius grahami]
MADQCDLCLLGLIILSSLLTGASGLNETHVFNSSGENVRLSCNNALSDCKSTTWLYSNRFRHSGTVSLIADGIKEKNTERRESLSLGSDCSLNIKNVTEEDYGLYTCRQYVNDEQQGTDAYVYLHVLHVSPSSSSSSSSQTEISPGRSVTLSCRLYSRLSCDSAGIHLLWVNQAGVALKTDSRYQILFSSDHCIITLTTTLLNEDDRVEMSACSQKSTPDLSQIHCQVFSDCDCCRFIRCSPSCSYSLDDSQKKRRINKHDLSIQQDRTLFLNR